MTAADPAHVIAVARSWLGTPYHDQASLRGIQAGQQTPKFRGVGGLNAGL